ncbi:hypothetical protein H8730_15690 [Clostridiales bacterium NSJ-32]|uniref:Uncharacterized protein n=2 Tax=Bianquea renquensis TaxID=2763661 RepID=A0A926I265_9FIRM|nr:hypothetical protein [Bianquea renquensis]
MLTKMHDRLEEKYPGLLKSCRFIRLCEHTGIGGIYR